MSEHYLTREDLNRILFISDTTRQRLEKTDPTFPAKLKIGAQRVVYLSSEVNQWLRKRHEIAMRKR